MARFFEGLGECARGACGWSDDDAFRPPPMAFDFSGSLALAPGADAEARLAHRLGVAGHPLSVALTLAQASSGRAAEWVATREGGRSGYRHKGSVELPLGSGGHAALLEVESEGRLALAARYEEQGGRAAQLGLETQTGDWLVPQRLALSLGSRHGALAAGIQARIGLRGAGSTVSEPKLRLEFEDNAVSAHCFVEDGRAGSCLQWRPPVLRGLHLTGGLRCSTAEDAALREYHLALDEAVVGAELQIEETVSTGLRVRRCFGEAVGDSVVQYAVTKDFEEGVALALVWQVIRLIGAEGLDRRGPAGPCRLFLGPGFRFAACWNRLGETVKTRKKREKTGKKWARYSLTRVKEGS